MKTSHLLSSRAIHSYLYKTTTRIWKSGNEICFFSPLSTDKHIHLDDLFSNIEIKKDTLNTDKGDPAEVIVTGKPQAEKQGYKKEVENNSSFGTLNKFNADSYGYRSQVKNNSSSYVSSASHSHHKRHQHDPEVSLKYQAPRQSAHYQQHLSSRSIARPTSGVYRTHHHHKKSLTEDAFKSNNQITETENSDLWSLFDEHISNHQHRQQEISDTESLTGLESSSDSIKFTLKPQESQKIELKRQSKQQHEPSDLQEQNQKTDDKFLAKLLEEAEVGTENYKKSEIINNKNSRSESSTDLLDSSLSPKIHDSKTLPIVSNKKRLDQVIVENSDVDMIKKKRSIDKGSSNNTNTRVNSLVNIETGPGLELKTVDLAVKSVSDSKRSSFTIDDQATINGSIPLEEVVETDDGIMMDTVSTGGENVSEVWVESGDAVDEATLCLLEQEDKVIDNEKQMTIPNKPEHHLSIKRYYKLLDTVKCFTNSDLKAVEESFMEALKCTNATDAFSNPNILEKLLWYYRKFIIHHMNDPEVKVRLFLKSLRCLNFSIDGTSVLVNDLLNIEHLLKLSDFNELKKEDHHIIVDLTKPYPFENTISLNNIRSVPSKAIHYEFLLICELLNGASFAYDYFVNVILRFYKHQIPSDLFEALVKVFKNDPKFVRELFDNNILCGNDINSDTMDELFNVYKMNGDVYAAQNLFDVYIRLPFIERFPSTATNEGLVKAQFEGYLTKLLEIYDVHFDKYSSFILKRICTMALSLLENFPDSFHEPQINDFLKRLYKKCTDRNLEYFYNSSIDSERRNHLLFELDNNANTHS